MIEQSPLDGPELYLCSGLPGFPGAHRFRLMPYGGTSGPFFRLLCLDRDLVFVVATPEVFFPDYAPQIDRATADRLGIAAESDAAVYVIVTVGSTPHEATANLLGPIVVNRRNLEAAQVVLRGTEWDISTPLLARDPAPNAPV